MNEPRQKIARQIAEGGCYFLCAIHIAEKLVQERIDPFDVYVKACDRSVMREDCYINDPATLMSLMVPGRWHISWADPGAVVDEQAFEVLRFERKLPGATLSHFVCGDRAGGIEYDPLGESLCVKQGKLVSKRIFRRMA